VFTPACGPARWRDTQASRREISGPAALPLGRRTVLLFLGGKALEDFASVLFVGIVTGTYSTTYVAAALVVDCTLWFEATSPTTKGSKARSG
jgi:hypothetical protein